MGLNNQSTQADLEAKIRDLTEMGFTEAQARSALTRFNNNAEQALNFLLTNTEDNDPEIAKAVAESLKDPTPVELSLMQDIEMNRAIENSIKEAGMDFVSYEPLNPESLKRKSGVPVGLKNIGNTCYFNSLIQTYFMIPGLVEEILTFAGHRPEVVEGNGNEPEQGNLTKKASVDLVIELQKLFSYLTFSSRKYIDPEKVLRSLVDDFGTQIRVGEQKDVGEFHLILVARIEEGLRTDKILDSPDSSDSKDSPVRRKESANFTGHKLNEHGLITRLFYGKQREYLKIENVSAPLINEVVFGQIILDVEEKDLYSAWDSSYHSEIDGYILENSITTKATQEIWPEHFPGVLLFQIQRVKYDLAVNNTVKINKRFSFPEEIFTDRFLKKKSEQSSRLRSEMLVLKGKARQIEAEIERFASYGGEGMSLEMIIENCLIFLQGQQDPVAMEVDGVYDPCNLLLRDFDLVTSQDVLKELKTKVVNRVKDLTEELNVIYEKIENLYNVPEMRQSSYMLHSLLVHDGYAGSGHYYSFVHDIEKNCWRKYSDLAISEVTFEEVYKDAVGGNGLASAYCLFYVSKDLLQKQRTAYWNFELNTMHDTHYYSLIPPQIVAEITADNTKLEEDIQSFQSSQSYTKITSLYESRISELEKIHRDNNNNGENIRYVLINFPFYLKCSYKDPELHKKYILHTSYRELTQKELSEIKWSDPVYPKLQAAYQSKLILTASDKEVIEKESQRYAEVSSIAEVFCVLVNMLMDDRLVDAFKLIVFNSEINTLELDEYSKFIREISAVLAFRCTSEIYKSFFAGDYSATVVFASIAGHLIINVLENADVVAKVCLQRIEEIFKDLSKKGEGFSGIAKDFAEVVKSVREKDVMAQVDFGEMPEECAIIRAKKEVFDRFGWYLGTGPEDIAVRYVKMKTKLNDVKLRPWFVLYENVKRMRSYNERGFKDAEQQSGLVLNRN